MIELNSDQMVYTFPETHPAAKLSIDLQRTLRIPDDDNTYPLPPGLGRFPLLHVDDYAESVPSSWLDRGGLMLPMYQSEALWLRFSSADADRRAPYPFLLRIAAGKINAVTGETWTDDTTVTGDPDQQDYMVVPEQPWLDGFAIEKGTIRQFVAMPLGEGLTAEEQLTGEAHWGGLQIQVHPMRRSVFERRFPKRSENRRMRSRSSGGDEPLMMGAAAAGSAAEMGLAPGGRMTQKIHSDPFDPSDWELDTRSRCFVHLCNSTTWSSVTGAPPPSTPPTVEDYNKRGLPWFAHYSETPAVGGNGPVTALKGVAELSSNQIREF